ncbi:MAG: tetratricopeptide repeat protein, partial [Deltaproteobacteria bacterium]|nr:tetratricopeptide repeat protein [Deltaproteobacteria bacterium]
MKRTRDFRRAAPAAFLALLAFPAVLNLSAALFGQPPATPDRVSSGIERLSSAGALPADESLDATLAAAATLARAGIFREAVPVYRKLAAETEKRRGPDDRKTLGVKVGLVCALSLGELFEEALDSGEPLFPKVREAFGDDSSETALLAEALGTACANTHDYARARRLFSENRERLARVFGEGSEEALAGNVKLSFALGLAAERDEAERILRETLAALESGRGSDDPDALDAALALSELLVFSKGDPGEGGQLARKTLGAGRTLYGSSHPFVANALKVLEKMAEARGDVPGALSATDEILAIESRTYGTDTMRYWRTLSDKAGLLKRSGDYPGALEARKAVLENAERISGPGNHETVVAKHNLADAFEDAGDYPEAIAAYREALEERLAFLGEEHPDVLANKSNLAGVLQKNGDYREALRLRREVLEARERTLGPEDPITLGSKSNLARLHNFLGEYDRARDLFREVLSVRERELGSDHPDARLAKNNLAVVLGNLGDYDEALRLYREQLAAEESLLGPADPSTLVTKNNLAVLLRETGEYSEALALYGEVLGESLRVLGPEHPNTLSTKQNLAEIHSILGNRAEALALSEEVLEARERISGPGDPSTLITKNNLINILLNAGEKERALALSLEVLGARERTLGPRHPHTLTSKSNLGALYLRSGDRAKARRLFEEVLSLRGIALGPDHPDTLSTKSNLAVLLYEEGDYSGARLFLREVLLAREANLGKDNPLTAATACNLGHVARAGGDLAKAIFYVKACIKATHLAKIDLRGSGPGVYEGFSESVRHRYRFLFELLMEAGREDEARELIELMKADEMGPGSLPPTERTTEPPTEPATPPGERDEILLVERERENIFRDTPEGPALDGFFDLASTVSALGAERLALIQREARGETLSSDEAARLETLDREMASRNREFNDFCDSVLPKMLKESEKREAERTRNLRGLQAT